LQQVL